MPKIKTKIIHGITNALAGITGKEVYRQTLPKPKGANEIILNLNGYSQVRAYTCGYVAALTVIEYLKGPKIGAARLFREMKIDEDGCGTEEIRRVLRLHGVKTATRYDLTFNQVVRFISDGKIIVASCGHGEHWINVVGVGLHPKKVFYTGNVASPSAKRISWKAFKEDGGCRGDNLICSI
ncbi:MAG: hypothetical protein JNL74_04730 [Fibrobacteres bacterium]|nr:hypothetical protein [Fibrobacterota bacterium]